MPLCDSEGNSLPSPPTNIDIDDGHDALNVSDTWAAMFTDGDPLSPISFSPYND